MADKAKNDTAPTSEWDFSKVETGVFSKVGTGKRRVDVEAEVPAPIRAKLEELYAENCKPDVKKPLYVDWNAGSVERAKDFVKLAQRYGKYRKDGRTTVRAQVFNNTWVHFTMKPLEVRNAAQ